MNRFLTFLLIGMCLSACKHGPIFKEVQAPGKFSLQIPAYMHATSELYSDGKFSMQYENDSAGTYMLVFDTARQNLNEKTLNDYYDSIVSGPLSQGANISPPKLSVVNNDSVIRTDMMITLNKTPVYYRIEVVATPKRFYYISLWGKMDKKEGLKPLFEKILDSFYDLNLTKT